MLRQQTKPYHVSSMCVCADALLMNDSQDNVSFEVLEGASKLIIMITHSQDVKKACSHVRACVYKMR